jgi:hypothetical protein
MVLDFVMCAEAEEVVDPVEGVVDPQQQGLAFPAMDKKAGSPAAGSGDESRGSHCLDEAWKKARARQGGREAGLPRAPDEAWRKLKQ